MASKDFTSLKSLINHLNNTSAGQSTLLNNVNVKKALMSEMERLQRYLIEEINAHYSSWTPEYYHRTGAWIESIRVNPIIQVGNSYSMSITFDDDMAYHSSVVDGGEDGYVPWLMEVGWKNHSYSTPHFDGFKGTHYIKKAVTRWNRDNKFGFKITVYHGDERYI